MDNIYKAVQLTIDSPNLALSKTPTHVYIANQYVDTNDTPLITAPFIIQKALENGTGVVDIVSSTIGSIYEVRLLCDAEVLISGYFYMPPMNVNFSELELYTSYPPRTPPVINEFWQQTEQYILEKTNTLLNFVQVFNSIASIRLLVGNLEDLLVVNNRSSLVGAVNQLKSIIDEISKNIGDKAKLSTEQKETIVGAINEIKSLISTHATKYDNPHQVTKAQVGLGNVDNTSDIDKPISKAMESALLEKADKTKTYSKEETTNLISGMITTTTSGHKGYLTYADAVAAKSTFTANTVVEVLADADINKNGVYLYNGTDFIKSAVDYVVKSEVKDIIGLKPYTNIADLSKAHKGYYYNYQNGMLVSISDDYTALGLYKIEPDTKYQVPATYVDQTAFFDSNMQFISGIPQVDVVTNQFTTPVNARYIGLSVKSKDINNFMFAKASEYPNSYIPYKETIPSILVDVSQVNNLDNKIYTALNTALPLSKPNIVDKTKVKNGFYVNYQNGNEYASDGYVVMGAYPVEPNTDYRISSWQTDQIAFYDVNNAFVGGIAQVDSITHVFKTPANAYFIKVTAKPTQINDLVLTKVVDWESETAEYGIKIRGLISDNSKITVVTASPDLNSDAQFKGKNCVQLAIDSITDASEQNRYVIKVSRGLAKITQANEFIGYIGYPCMICMKDWVDVEGAGIGETILWAELPYADASIGVSIDGNTYARDRYQALYNYSDNSKISNLTLVAKNLRYTNHQDDSRGANKLHNYENVELIFKGNKGYLKAWGCGDHSGESTTVVGGSSHSDSGDVFAVHNNIKFSNPSSWDFKDHTFTSMGSKVAIELQNDGSLLKDKFSLVGCSFGGMSYIINYVDVWLSGNTAQNNDTFDHAEWRLTGHSNEPFLFNNSIANGLALRIKSKSTGATSTVRFDKSSSAFDLLVKNKRVNSDTSLSYKYDFVDSYLVKDGSTGLSGQAIGGIDLSEAVYWYDNGVNYTSLAKRLGNLSSGAKSLVVIVDGVTSTVNFNKDYSAMSNTQILAEINAQLTNAVADLHVYGREYYPQMPDVSELCFNNTSSFIAKGSVVTKQGGFVKLANANDDVFGVALEDIPVMQTTSDGEVKGSGLVLKRGYILTDKSKAHFVLADNQSLAVGTRFSVSNGQLVTESNGKISMDIDAGVVSINC